MKAAQSAILLWACSTISAVRAQCTSVEDGTIPGGTLTCDSWAGDSDKNGEVDCFASQDANNVQKGFNAEEMKAVRTACPYSCTEGAPRSKLNHLLGTKKSVAKCTRRLALPRRLAETDSTAAPTAAPTPPPTPPPTIPYCEPPSTTLFTVTSTNVSTTLTTTNTTELPTVTTTNTTTLTTATTTNTTTLTTATTTNTTTLTTQTTTNTSTSSIPSTTTSNTSTYTPTTTNTTTTSYTTSTITDTTTNYTTTTTNTTLAVQVTVATVTTTNTTTLTTATTTNTTTLTTATTTNTTTVVTQTTTNTTVVTVQTSTTSNASTTTQYCIPVDYTPTPAPTVKPAPPPTTKAAVTTQPGGGSQEPDAGCTQPAAGTGCNTNCMTPPQVSPVTCDCQTFTGGEYQAKCSLWNVLNQCMGSVGAFHCPEGSSSNRETNYVQFGGVTCEVCKYTNNVTDFDTRTSFVQFGLKWGPLQNSAGNLVAQGGAIRYDITTDDSKVKSYTVWFVDADGRRISRAKTAAGNNIEVPATAQKPGKTNCCQEDKYQVTVKDQIPSGAKYLMIVPKYLAAKGKLGDSALREPDTMVELPQGVLVPVSDVEGKTQTVVKGSLEMVVSIPAGKTGEDLIADEAFTAGVADGIANAVGIDPDLVTITGIIVVPATRRLAEVTGRQLSEIRENEMRRLATDASIKVEYEIIVPPEASGLKAADGKAITAESLKAKLTSNTIADDLKTAITQSVNKKIAEGGLEGFDTLVVKDIPKDKVAAPEEEVLEAPKPAAGGAAGAGGSGGDSAGEGEATGGVHHKSSVGVLAPIFAVASTMGLLGRIA